MNRRKKTKCAGCGHRRPITHSKDSFKICNYILDTGEPRGCPVEKCTHYTKEKCHIKEDIKWID